MWTRFKCWFGFHCLHDFGDITMCCRCRWRYRVLDTTHWELDIVDTCLVHDIEHQDACELPPVGWFCSRAQHHDGPCAARPVD